MTVLIVVLWLAAALSAVHLVATWMERRGWIYYRRQGGKPMGVAASNALLHFEAMVNPAAEHVIEELERDDADLSTSGAPLEPGEDDPRRHA